MDEQRQQVMSKKSNDDLVQRTRPCYLQANRLEKTLILDEFIAATGAHRQHTHPFQPNPVKPKIWA
jgi:hypothetical protein